MQINIGRYIPGNTLIHRMDARLKLLANIAFISLFFVANNYIMQGILIFPIIVAFLMITKNPLKLLKTLKLPIWVGIFMFLINAFVLNTNDQNYKELDQLWGETLNWNNWTEYNVVNWNGWFKINYKVVMTTVNVMFRAVSYTHLTLPTNRS